jgi:S-DNA-T family DNA segregation ATPase FtsK/SpoIIIE
MVSSIVFTPPPRPQAAPPQGQIPVEDPLDNETKKKAGFFQQLMPVIMIVGMGGMMAMMFMLMRQSGQVNPMMLMFPMMMIPAMLPAITQGLGGGIDIGELNEKRAEYAMAQREARTRLHDQGEKVHNQQARQFPPPAALINYIGSENIDHPVMWTVNSAERGGLHVEVADVSDEEREDRKFITYEAYLAPRIGVGTIRRIPPLDIPDKQQVPELVEPVSHALWRRFIIINSFMPAMPVALDLGSAPFYGFIGDADAIRSTARAMICSLAFNHAPTELRIGIVSPDIDHERWDWMKWLPHVEDRTRRDAHGVARRAYHSINEFHQAHKAELSTRGTYSAKTNISPRWIVFIDDADHEVNRPAGMSEGGVDGVTVVVLQAGATNMVGEARNQFQITADRDLVVASGKVQAKADAMSVLDAQLFAKAMSRYTAHGTGSLEQMASAATSSKTDEAIPDFFDVLGIKDIDDWDPRVRWNKIRFDSHLDFPIGYVRDTSDPRAVTPTAELAELDLIEMAKGGTTHGTGQGVTGSGKSYLLATWIATLAARFGPDRLAFVLADMKGGSAFNMFRNLPHVAATITNLEGDTEFVDRFGTVLRGEIQARLEFFAKHDAKDIYEYRQLMQDDPDTHPALPDLLVIIDEYGKFADMMNSQPENRAALIDIGRQGRSIGIHLLPVSQTLDSMIMGEDLWQHMLFRFTLKADNERSSINMIGAPDAKYVKAPAAFIRYTAGDKDGQLVPFMAFSSEDEYHPKGEVDIVDSDVVEVSEDTSIVPFTLANVAVEGGDDGPEGSPQVSALAAAAAAYEEEEITPKKKQVPRDKQMIQILTNKLETYTEVHAPVIWLPSLREPVTLADDTMQITPVTDIANPTFRLGDIDDAYHHDRPPLLLTTTGSFSNVAVLGQSRSGLTTTLAAIIGSASVSHDPKLASFYVVDPTGAGLNPISGYYNVGAYASRTDSELIARLIGEAARLTSYREERMARERHANFPAYWNSRTDNTNPDDPYGHFYLVIDRLDTLLERHPEFEAPILQVLSAGAAVGVHVICSAAQLRYKHEALFGKVYLACNVDNMMFPDRDQRLAVKDIDDRYPGRTISLSEPWLPARVLLPVLRKPEPIRNSKGEIEGWPSDYTDGIAQAGYSIREFKASNGVAPAPEVRMVSEVVPYVDFWRSYIELPEATTDRRLPLGISTGDLKYILAPTQPSPHLVVAGTAKSGRTNALRVMINNILQQQYTPQEAQIFIADKSFRLKAEADTLSRSGYIQAGGYAYDDATAQTMMRTINTYAAQRRPDPSQITARQIQDGSYWSGPRLFVLIDDYARFTDGGYSMTSVFDGLAEHIGSLDIGMTVILTMTDNEYTSFKEGYTGLPKALQNVQTPLLALSGGGSNVVRPMVGEEMAVKFKNRRPGEAMLMQPSAIDQLPVLQMPYADPWPDVG